jgi:hypothetical protein
MTPIPNYGKAGHSSLRRFDVARDLRLCVSDHSAKAFLRLSSDIFGCAGDTIFVNRSLHAMTCPLFDLSTSKMKIGSYVRAIQRFGERIILMRVV